MDDPTQGPATNPAMEAELPAVEYAARILPEYHGATLFLSWRIEGRNDEEGPYKNGPYGRAVAVPGDMPAGTLREFLLEIGRRNVEAALRMLTGMQGDSTGDLVPPASPASATPE